MRQIEYDRGRAVRYAHKWAHDRNPKYASFDKDGGDCTNFASQALFEGCGVMHPRDWYYIDAARRAPAWTSVTMLYRFLMGNRQAGPFAAEVDAAQIQPGDLVQLWFPEKDRFSHTPVVVQVGEPGDPHQILVAAHTFNSDNRPLSSYAYAQARFLHILGARQ